MGSRRYRQLFLFLVVLRGDSGELARITDEARRTEYAERRFDRGPGLYRDAAAIAHDDAQRATARLDLARTRLHPGQSAAALAAYRKVLEWSSPISDNNHLCNWSSAATPLVELGAGLAGAVIAMGCASRRF
jgi:hypothetical protein